jgi:glutamyl-tRNA synthetase
VIQRADGSCLYHLATVVDDHDFKISHVIRAEEHLSNTPRQVFIAQQLGYALPQFAHLPVVAEPGSKNKLSKRKLDKYLKNREFAETAKRGQKIAERLGLETSAETFNPVIVDFYEQVGYLPDALVNYLLLLGWSLDDKTEFLTRQEMIDHFSLGRVSRGPASFDPAKLDAFQQHYMQRVPIPQKVELVLPYLQRAGLVSLTLSPDVASTVRRILQAAGDRVKLAGDILDYDDFFRPDEDLPYDEQAFQKRLRGTPKAAGLLGHFRGHLAEVDPFEPEPIEAALKAFVASERIKIGQIIHAVRVAATGKSVGFGLFDSLAILGKQSCLTRIDRALVRLSAS